MSLKTDTKDTPEEKLAASPEARPMDLPPLEDLRKGRWERSWPTIACGAGLFSDGYLNGVCAHHSSRWEHGICLSYKVDDIT